MPKILPFLLSIIVLSLLVPLAAEAVANVYKASNGESVCYEGFVPCGLGKQIWRGGIIDGECDKGNPIVTTFRSGGRTTTADGMSCQFCHIFIMINGIIRYVLVSIIPPLAILMIVVGGVMFYFGGGNPKLLDRGKQLIKGVFIGLALIYGAYMIVGAILAIVGVADWTGLGSWAAQGPFSIACPIVLP